MAKEITKQAGVSGNSVAGKSFQMFTVSEELLAKVVEAVQAGEKKARSSGDIQSLEVFCHGFRQNISLGRVYIVPPAVCSDRKNFPTALLHGALVRVFGTGGEEMSDLIEKRIGESEFDEYSQADFDSIKEQLFVDPQTEKEACLVIFAPNWMNTREYICFHFTKDSEKLKNNLRHQVFAAYYAPYVSSAFNALMTNVNTTKVDVTDITPKLSTPFLTENLLKEYPELVKQAGKQKPTILLNRKTADAVAKESLDPQELNVFDALDSALENSLLPDTRDAESAGGRDEGYKAPEMDGGVPRAASKKAHTGADGKCLGCKESAEKCSCEGCGCKQASEEEKENPLASHEAPFSNVGPGTEAEAAQKDTAPAVKESFEDSVKENKEKATEPIGIEIDEKGLPVHKGDKKVEASKKKALVKSDNQKTNKQEQKHPETLRVGQERLSTAASELFNGGFVNKADWPPASIAEYAGKHIGNNDGYAPHAVADHQKQIEAGAFGEDALSRRSNEKWGSVTAAQIKADFIAEHIAADFFDDGEEVSSPKAKKANVAREAHLDKFRDKTAVSLDIDSIWDEITEDMGPAPLVDVDGSAESNPAPSNTEGESQSTPGDAQEEPRSGARPNKRDVGDLPEAFRSPEPEDEKSLSDSTADEQEDSMPHADSDTGENTAPWDKEGTWRVAADSADFVGEVFDDVNNEEDGSAEFLGAAEQAIQNDDQIIYDVASNAGQLVDNVKHMQWFVDAVAQALSEEQGAEMQMNEFSDHLGTGNAGEGTPGVQEPSSSPSPSGGGIAQGLSTAMEVLPMLATDKNADANDRAHALSQTEALMDLENEIWDRLGINSGGEIMENPQLEAQYQAAMAEALKPYGRVDQSVIDELENENYHQLVKLLTQMQRGKKADTADNEYDIDAAAQPGDKELGKSPTVECHEDHDEKGQVYASRKKADTADNPANEDGGEGAISVKTNKEIKNTRGNEPPSASAPANHSKHSSKTADTADNPALEKGGEGALCQKGEVSNTRGEELPSANTPANHSKHAAASPELKEKLHPRKVGGSGKWAAVVGYILDEVYTDPSITEMAVTSDGHVMAAASNDLGMNEILGSETDLQNNWKRYLQAAQLTPEEINQANALFREKITNYRTGPEEPEQEQRPAMSGHGTASAKTADTADNPYNMQNDGEGAPENKKVVTKKDTSGPTPDNTKQANQNKGVLQEVGEKHDHGVEGDIAQAKAESDSPDSVDQDISQPTVSVLDAGKRKNAGMWMNEYEIQEAARDFPQNTALGKAARFLQEFVEQVNSHSDGWPYWKQPGRAAGQLMDILYNARMNRMRGEGAAQVDDKMILKALAPIKSFMTRRGTAAGMTMPAYGGTPELQGTEGQDRKSYSDTQDRDSYTVDPELEKESAAPLSDSLKRMQDATEQSTQHAQKTKRVLDQRTDQALDKMFPLNEKEGADISGDMSEAKSELSYNKAEIADDPQATQTKSVEEAGGRKNSAIKQMVGPKHDGGVDGDLAQAKSEVDFNKADIAGDSAATQTVNPDHFASGDTDGTEDWNEKAMQEERQRAKKKKKEGATLDNYGGQSACAQCGQPIAEGEMVLYGKGGAEQHQDCRGAAQRAQQQQKMTPSQRIQNLPQRGSPKSPQQLGLQPKQQESGFAPMSSKEAAAGDDMPESAPFDFGAGDLADIVLVEDTDESE